MATIRSRRVVLDGEVRPASLSIDDGTVSAIGEWHARGATDFGDLVLMPGLVDTHVHINEPGRTSWEGFATATRAAAAGGVTTLLDMPLNSIPATVSVAALEAKRQAARGQCHVDVGFIGGVVPGNAAQLEPLWRAGVRAFKCFLVPSGVDEFPAVAERDLRAALPILASLGAPLMVHAELPDAVSAVPPGTRRYTDYLATRPPAAEHGAVTLVARLATELGARVHIVHVSSPASVEVVRRARAAGAQITCEA